MPSRVPTIEEIQVLFEARAAKRRVSRSIGGFKALKFRLPVVRQWALGVIKDIRNDTSPGGERGWLDETGALGATMRPEIRWQQQRVGVQMLFYGAILDKSPRFESQGFVARAFLARKRILYQLVKQEVENRVRP